MITPKLRNILTDIGFELKCNEYVGSFLYSPTGNMITIIAKETEDDRNVSQLIFDAFDLCGNLLSSQTLDQILVEADRNLIPIKVPSKKFVTTYNLLIQVPTDLTKMDKKTYANYIEEHECEDALGVAELAAREELGNFLRYCPFNVIEFDPMGTEEVK